jgi:hypothetical protein
MTDRMSEEVTRFCDELDAKLLQDKFGIHFGIQCFVRHMVLSQIIGLAELQQRKASQHIYDEQKQNLSIMRMALAGLMHKDEELERSLTSLEKHFPEIHSSFFDQANVAKLKEQIIPQCHQRLMSMGDGVAEEVIRRRSACFVASVVFENPECSEIEVLRMWRDEVLAKTCVGRGLIAGYYRYGPVIAAVVARCPALRSLLAKPMRWFARWCAVKFG